MAWYVYLFNFFAGALFANGIPHFIHGISGKKFRTPFAKPGGESSPVINVVWGVVNFLVGYALLFGIGNFVLGFNRSAQMIALGFVVMAVLLSISFGRVRGR